MLTGKPDNPKGELPPRGRLSAWIESRPVQGLIIALIVVNAAILGMETSPALMAVLGPGIILADRIIMGIFVAEIALKLIASCLLYTSPSPRDDTLSRMQSYA